MSILRNRGGAIQPDGKKHYKDYWLCCDFCGENYPKSSANFEKVLVTKMTSAKDAGWTCRKDYDGWWDLCPKCRWKV